MFGTIYRTIFFYFFVAFAYRIMGKREVGQLGIIDLIVSILIAELVAISIENYHDSVFLTIVPISILVLLELGLGYLSVKFRFLNRFFGGRPTTIIDHGKILYKNMVSQRYSIDDLLLELRKKGIYSIEDVWYAFLEPNGILSVYEKNNSCKTRYPLPIIVEGKIQNNSLLNLGKSKKWLLDLLDKNNINVSNVFYGLYGDNHIYIIRR